MADEHVVCVVGVGMMGYAGLRSSSRLLRACQRYRTRSAGLEVAAHSSCTVNCLCVLAASNGTQWKMSGDGAPLYLRSARLYARHRRRMTYEISKGTPESSKMRLTRF